MPLALSPSQNRHPSPSFTISIFFLHPYTYSFSLNLNITHSFPCFILFKSFLKLCPICNSPATCGFVFDLWFRRLWASHAADDSGRWWKIKVGLVLLCFLWVELPFKWISHFFFSLGWWFSFSSPSGRIPAWWSTANGDEASLFRLKPCKHHLPHWFWILG